MGTYLIQLDLKKIDQERIVEKKRQNGEEAWLYSFIAVVDDAPDEYNNVGEAYEKLLKAEYDDGKNGRLIGYVQKHNRDLLRKGALGKIGEKVKTLFNPKK